MSFKLYKSRVLVLKRGKVVDKLRFIISDIISLSAKPVKSLGKLFDCSMKDTAAIHKTCGALEVWLTKIEKSGLPGWLQGLDIPACHSAQGFEALVAV